MRPKQPKGQADVFYDAAHTAVCGDGTAGSFRISRPKTITAIIAADSVSSNAGKLAALWSNQLVRRIKRSIIRLLIICAPQFRFYR